MHVAAGNAAFACVLLLLRVGLPQKACMPGTCEMHAAPPSPPPTSNGSSQTLPLTHCFLHTCSLHTAPFVLCHGALQHWQPPGAPPSGRPPTQQPTSSTVGTFRQMPCEMAMAAIHGLELLDITPASEFNTHALAELGKLPPILQLGILGHYMNRPACWQNPSRSLVDSAEYAQRKHLINPPPWLRGKWLGSNCSLAPGARAKLDKLVSKGALEPLHRFPEGRAALDELQGLPYPLQDQTVNAALWDLQGCLNCFAQGFVSWRWGHQGETGVDLWLVAAAQGAAPAFL